MAIPVLHSKMEDEEADIYMQTGFVQPFQLFTQQPLCRFEIVETEKRTLLLSDLHHSIADGFTIAGRLIGTDLPTAYAGISLEKPRLTLFDWAKCEQEVLKSPAYTRAREYYQSLYADVDVTRLSAAQLNGSGKGIMAKVSLQMNAVEKWCADRHVAVYHFLISAFCLTLSKLSHSRKVVFCTLNHGRYDKRLGEAYGMFVNTMPFFAEIDEEMTLEMLMGQVRRRLMDNYRHRAYPFTHFCSDMGLVPKITFGFQSEGILEQTIIDGHLYKGMQLPRPDSQSDLSVMVYSSGDEYEIRVEANDAMYGKTDLKRFADAMQHCIGELMLNDNRPITEIELVDEEQKQQLLCLSAGEKMNNLPPQTVVGMFLQQALASPKATAVEDASNILTYSELECRSRSLAYQLIAEGVKTGSFVGVDTTPCCEFLIAVMAIMRAGAAYVPIDTHLPTKRRIHILEDAGIGLVVDRTYVSTHAILDKSALPINHSYAQGTAYMIYTSGSSGKPKGVVVRHNGLSNLVHFCVRRWPLEANSRIACHSSLAFDASVEDLFPVLSVGGCVIFVPSEVRTDLNLLALFIRQRQVTGGCFTTRLGLALAEAHHIDLEYFCLGGERLTVNPKVGGKVYNTYGPTEFTVDATYYELEEDKQYDNIPIGRPVDNCHAFVVDTYGNLLPQGAVGELWLAGPQIAVGYWNSPQLTADKFTACSFFNGTVYHTGDLVRWNDDGLLEYVGRLDNQVKIDGVRISLEEIEQHLIEIPGVVEAAAVTHDVNGKSQIWAFYTANCALTSDAIREMLKESLPLQMIPKKLVRLTIMPLTASGKIDKNNLHVEALNVPDVAPADAVEWALCQLMANVLGLKQVGANDDFFTMGGTSISAMQMVAEARKSGFSLEYADIFSHPTPRQMSDCINRKDKTLEKNIDNYDYGAINRLLSQEMPHRGESYPNGGILMLTGATGFLGIHVLARFLFSKSWNVICLVRGDDIEGAWKRLKDRWSYYFPFQPLETDKVSVVCGDLVKPSSLGDLEKLPFDIIINCAADVRYFAKDNNIMQVNAYGTEYLARLCMKREIRMIQISTVSIAGINSPCTLSSMSFSSQQLIDQYSYSKFVAERFILEQMAHDRLKANIIRVGYLVPRSREGKTQINDAENMLSSLLKVMADLGGCPNSSLHFEIIWVPVDDVSDSIFDSAVMCPTHPVIHAEMKKCSLKKLADLYAGRELMLWTDDEFRNRIYRQHKTGIWVHFIDMMMNNQNYSQ